MARNPKANPLKVLGITPAAYNTARAALEAFLTANDDQEDIPEANMRASLPAPVSDRVWNFLKQETGII